MKKINLLFVFILSFNFIIAQSINKFDKSVTSKAGSLVISPLYLNFGNVPIGEISIEKSCSVGGTYLVADVMVTVGSGFLLTSNSGQDYNDTIYLTPTEGFINTSVFVIFQPGFPQMYTGLVKFESPDVSNKLVTVFGVGLDSTLPTITASPFYFNFGDVQINESSEVQSYILTGANLTEDIVVTAPVDFMVSLSPEADFLNSITVPQIDGSVETVVFVKFMPTFVQAYASVISNVSLGAAVVNVGVIGNCIDIYAPTLVADPLFLNFGNVSLGVSSTPQQYLLTGLNISEFVEIIAPVGFEISSDGLNYSSSVYLEPTFGLLEATVYVAFLPEFEQLYTGVISNTTGLVVTNIPVTGIGTTSTNFTVNFRVTDQELLPIAGAQVTLGSFADVTNNNGVINFPNIEIGTHQYSIAFGDYETILGSIDVVDQDVSLDISFMPNSIENFKSKNINIYPNPTSGKFTINTPNFSEKYLSVKICDFSGKIIIDQKLTHSDFNEIDLSDCNKGIYFIQILNANKSYSSKLIIQ